MAVLCFIYVIMALRTNICFVAIFFLVAVGLSFSAAANWRLAIDYDGNIDAANKLVMVRNSAHIQILIP